MCLMVFARAALASGPGTAWISIHYALTWRKVKGAKIASRMSFDHFLMDGLKFFDLLTAPYILDIVFFILSD